MSASTLPDGPPEPTVAENELAEPVLVPPRGLWAVALALFAVAAALALLLAPPVQPRLQPDLHLETWRQTDLAALRQPDDALLQRPPRDPAQTALEANLLRQFASYLQQESALGPATADDPAARQLLGALEEDVRRLVTGYGADALRRLSVRFGRDVRAAVEASLAAAQAAHQPWAQHLLVVPLPADVSELRAVSGALGSTLARIGLDRHVRAGQLDPAAGQIVETLAQARFLQLAVRVPGGAPQLPSSAWFLVQHFRVEAHAGLDLQRRLALLDELASTDPAYPSDYARGVLLAREEAFAEAAHAFDRAAGHGALARQARENARWCRHRAREATLPAPAVVP